MPTDGSARSDPPGVQTERIRESRLDDRALSVVSHRPRMTLGRSTPAAAMLSGFRAVASWPRASNVAAHYRVRATVVDDFWCACQGHAGLKGWPVGLRTDRGATVATSRFAPLQLPGLRCRDRGPRHGGRIRASAWWGGGGDRDDREACLGRTSQQVVATRLARRERSGPSLSLRIRPMRRDGRWRPRSISSRRRRPRPCIGDQPVCGGGDALVVCDDHRCLPRRAGARTV